MRINTFSSLNFYEDIMIHSVNTYRVPDSQIKEAEKFFPKTACFESPSSTEPRRPFFFLHFYFSMNTSNYSFLVFCLPNIHGLSMKIVLKSGLDVHSHLQLRDVFEGLFPVWLEASHMLCAALPLFIPRNCPVSHFSSLGLVGILSAWLPRQPFNPE